MPIRNSSAITRATRANLVGQSLKDLKREIETYIIKKPVTIRPALKITAAATPLL
jgi:hypothetical protein